VVVLPLMVTVDLEELVLVAPPDCRLELLMDTDVFEDSWVDVAVESPATVGVGVVLGEGEAGAAGVLLVSGLSSELLVWVLAR
jgi:hypothetical protein